MAGWGDDPELEKLRGLIEDGWEVTGIEEVSGSGGPMDKVTLQRDGATEEVTSDHLAFHRYVEYLRDESR